jgi:flagellar basal-body rod protein FlgG
VSNTRDVDVGLYTAASGMVAEQVRQDQLANDLSNASTPGYKPDRATQRSFPELLMTNTATGQQVGNVGTGVAVDRIATDLSQAPLRDTGQPLDFAIAGPGFFAVRTATGVRYTRDGQFSSDAQGRLVTAQGDPVLSQSGATISVGAKGTVPVTALGVFNVSGAAKQGDNLFTGTAAGAAGGTVKQGALEGSGVDPARTMVEMITSLRAFEAGQKAIQAIDETMQHSATQVGALGGGA